MKKLRIILIALCALIAFGLIGFMVFIMNGGGFHISNNNAYYCNSSAKLVSDESINAGDIKDIDVRYNGTPFDIFIKKSNDDKITVKQYLCDEKFLGKVENSNGNLIISGPKYKNYSFISIGINSNFGYIEVYVPDKDYDSINVQTSSGEVYIETDISSKLMKLISTSGDVKAGVKLNIKGDFISESSSGEAYLDDLTASNIRISSTSGDVNVRKISGKTKVSTSSGEITLGDLNGDYDLKSTSGDIQVENATGVCEANTTSGAVRIDSNEFSGYVHSTSGDLTIKADTFTDDVKLSTTSGEVRMRVSEESSFYVDMNTTSGEITTAFDDDLSFDKDGDHVKGTYGDNKSDISIDIQTTSGDISINFK